MPPHPLSNFEIQKYYENEPKFDGVYSRNNFYEIKDRTYIINLDEYESIGTHWVALFVNDNDVTYFDSFEVEHISKKISKFIGNKHIITNIYRMRFYVWIVKSLLDYANLFSPNDHEKDDKIILRYFQ